MSDPAAPQTDFPRLPSRRTILVGAAWSVPAIAAVTASPASAASYDTTLTFDQSSYTGPVCGTIDGAYVTATVNNAPAGGKAVTVTLSNNYSFSGGATSYTDTTGSDGRVTLPSISVPSNGGTGTATASAATASATSAAMNATANYAKFFTGTNGNPSGTLNFANVPASAVPVGGFGVFLDGSDLWYGNTVIASGVTKARGNRSDTRDYFSFIQNGVAKSVYGSNGSISGTRTWANVPSTAEPVGAYGTFLDSGNLWYFDSVVYTGVTKATGLSRSLTNGWRDEVGFINDSARTFSGSNGTIGQNWQQQPRVPLSADLVRVPGWWLAGTDLWAGNRLILSGVSRASGSMLQDGSMKVSFVQGGVAKTLTSDRAVQNFSTTTFPNIPGSGIPVGSWGTFIDGSNLWYNDAIIEANAARAVGDGTQNNTDHVSFIKKAC
ncbi:hypothetical protein [Microbacterium sp. HMWF026]|uniref:hypothetical protein n=1 Tax=Microbacterium sp. HMWF026 TaxID=2056861 RepID=UPI0011B1EEC2|nr:hypothetical protein [Microbacterium sp. HMWF026]